MANKEKLCIYCGENKAMTQIPNPNTWEEEPMFWDVCLMCKEVIENQMKLSMGEIFSSKPYCKEIGEKMIEEATKRLNEIAFESNTPILSVELKQNDGM
jgi:hypothetical protein